MKHWPYFFGSPSFVPAPRVYLGCMGRIVPGLPPYAGYFAQQPELLFSWLLHRVPSVWQQNALAVFKAAGDQDFLLSWPDFNGTPDQFGTLIQKVRRAGFRPVVMLSAKGGPSDLAGVLATIAPVLPVLRRLRVQRVCVGWELNSWLSPEVLQGLIDYLAPIVRGWGGVLYVHFTEGYAAWQPNGLLFADFWKRNVDLLRGVLHQKVMTQTDIQYQTGEGGLRDILLHFNGGSGCPADSGDGTPFDLVALEVDLELFSENQINEAEMHRRARVGLATPPTSGPTGEVRVMGSGCGL